jgi:CheY-like chemotaxis protein
MPEILVVDDDNSHRALMCDLLEEMGYQATQAANGLEALKAMTGVLPAAVLLDLQMPVMSGWGLLEALKGIPGASAVPVIIISGYGFEWEADLAGAAGYISKPVDLERVRDTVRRFAGSPGRPGASGCIEGHRSNDGLCPRRAFGEMGAWRQTKARRRCGRAGWSSASVTSGPSTRWT